MKFQITHTTVYSYSAPVVLQPHTLRLRPRSDGWQTLTAFGVDVDPAPQGISPVNDLDGNSVIQLWFHPQAVERLTIQICAEVETHCTNPFHYILEPWARQIPISYPAAIGQQLQPYLCQQMFGQPAVPDPTAIDLAKMLLQETEGNVSAFLSKLNQQIYTTCRQVIREEGAPMPPSVTWSQKLGSCRDFAVLFMETCRAIGLATRFVSGYHQVDPGNTAHLHAWVEVYLPGAGWRGYDPTQNVVVYDRHVALAAAALPYYAAPVQGTFQGANIQDTMQYMLRVDCTEDG